MCRHEGGNLCVTASYPRAPLDSSLMADVKMMMQNGRIRDEGLAATTFGYCGQEPQEHQKKHVVTPRQNECCTAPALLRNKPFTWHVSLTFFNT